LIFSRGTPWLAVSARIALECQKLLFFSLPIDPNAVLVS
jgi:hypothetical protein